MISRVSHWADACCLRFRFEFFHHVYSSLASYFMRTAEPEICAPDWDNALYKPPFRVRSGEAAMHFPSSGFSGSGGFIV